MKKKYKEIHFTKEVNGMGKTVYRCRLNFTNIEIGYVAYIEEREAYAFISEHVMFGVDCLQDIIDFIQQLK